MPPRRSHAAAGARSCGIAVATTISSSERIAVRHRRRRATGRVAARPDRRPPRPAAPAALRRAPRTRGDRCCRRARRSRPARSPSTSTRSARSAGRRSSGCSAPTPSVSRSHDRRSRFVTTLPNRSMRDHDAVQHAVVERAASAGRAARSRRRAGRARKAARPSTATRRPAQTGRGLRTCGSPSGARSGARSARRLSSAASPQHGREHAVVGRDEPPVAGLGGQAAARGADARVDDDQKDRARREVPIRRRQLVRPRTAMSCGGRSCETSTSVTSGLIAEHHALHHARVMVACAEIGEEGNEGFAMSPWPPGVRRNSVRTACGTASRGCCS